MALPWLKVLKSVPWSDVIAAAPQVANGARRLWDTVGRKPGPAPQPDLGEAMAHLPPEEDIALLAARIEQHEATMAQLHGQVRDASRLITELADQNAQLIAKMEAARERLNLVGFVAAAGVVVSIVALALALAHT
ncbi:hypothetical protein G4G28_10815 [Massilia sp. Dwa41.01b]|uniref:hypothetical protein n=1 Tax=unclassified Massilia TaxID=2609279 RepID=UPI001602F9C2|nr:MULTISPECIES: hypothetical protein [unclassified Massilia]QNA88852.1 hypothetical protein G4G28_10815 [Massilia sp. Dwa41.01b]QNA99743.1 hypothetical protein G4G31_14450 [Massilia sp. Se16.2.3]